VLPDGLNRPQPPSAIDLPKVLLVEGQDPFQFFKALLGHLGLLDSVEVLNYGGVGDLPLFLKTLKAISGFPEVVSLGIVRDAELNAAGAFQSVCGAITRAGLDAPAKPMSRTAGKPSLSILVLPDGTSPGMLETVCLDSVSTDAALPCVDQFFECLKSRNVILAGNRAKARLHAYLASRPIPYLLLGQAAHKQYFPWDSPAFARVKEFLRAL
jgi:hypothetical protein